jgi:PAS domain S-box-containing protein
LLADFGIAAVATDLDGIVCECNHVAAALFGRRQSAMLGVPLGTVSLAQADGSGVGSILRGLLGVGRWRGEFEMQDANGLPLRLDVRARVVRNRGGRPIGVEAVFENLSERVEAERRASMSDARR